MKVRIEVPVLLYADLRMPEDATEDGQLTESAKRNILQCLGYALGEVGEEPPEPACTVELPRFTDARLYLTDSPFPRSQLGQLELNQPGKRHAPCGRSVKPLSSWKTIQAFSTPGFFLMAGQRSATHSRRAFSLRSRACLAGRCSVQFMAPRIFHTCPGW